TYTNSPFISARELVQATLSPINARSDWWPSVLEVMMRVATVVLCVFLKPATASPSFTSASRSNFPPRRRHRHPHAAPQPVRPCPRPRHQPSRLSRLHPHRRQSPARNG